MPRSPMRPTLEIAALLLGSGTCALIYQTTWLRELRMVFGASTAASAAVLAIFMGGLGFGGLVLGKRADAHPNPLLLYARLEGLVAVTAALTPGLLWAIAKVYIALGGTAALGDLFGTALRLALSTLVLGLTCFLMGGTLPAAARAAETEADVGRRHLAVLYAANTFGAVMGAFASTFFLLEIYGNHRTLWIAALLNALVAVVARRVALSREGAPAPRAEDEGDDSVAPVAAPSPSGSLPPAPFVLAAAAVVGFSFFLIELVWYRMLGPLLGGTTFTFSIILAVALAGIGAGGLFYALFAGDRTPSLHAFALVSALEAALLALPLALGDQIAVLAQLLRPLGAFGFAGHVAAWCGVAGIVILPGALVSGVQFPMLIALLGRGRAGVGRQLGAAYAWNTVGAILGSLAGGFGLLPLLTAPGAWRLAVISLLVLGAAALALGRRGGSGRSALAPLVVGAAAVAFLLAPGPTAAWRHSPIGAGRVTEPLGTPDEIRGWLNQQRRKITWERDGVESSVALDTSDSFSFVVAGKSDGNARSDAGTQIGLGLVAALRHGAVERAMVIGLGTGSTAGWLGAIEGIERVDVAELEPAIGHVAEVCAAVNADVMTNPKVHITYGDAREILLTSRDRYDIIVSEPSNPYRAGIASLFTVEYYAAASERLNPGGLFTQWLQAYEVDNPTVQTVYATLRSVFPHVETWQTQGGDLLLLASPTPLVMDTSAIRQRLAQPPFAQGFKHIWRVDDVEGILSHYVGSSELADRVAAEAGDQLNTDDRALLEFGFGRSVGASLFDVAAFRELGQRHFIPPELLADRTVDWRSVHDQSLALETLNGELPAAIWLDGPKAQALHRALSAYVLLDFPGALAAWRGLDREPDNLIELEMVSELMAEAGDSAALPYLEALSRPLPLTALALRARLAIRQGRLEDAGALTEAALSAYRGDPWPSPPIMLRALGAGLGIAATDPALAGRLWRALDGPFSAGMHEHIRQRLRYELSQYVGFFEHCEEALAPMEPHVPWEVGLLQGRAACYERNRNPAAGRAFADLAAIQRAQPQPVLRR